MHSDIMMHKASAYRLSHMPYHGRICLEVADTGFQE